jgi:hypothetical protein
MIRRGLCLSAAILLVAAAPGFGGASAAGSAQDAAACDAALALLKEHLPAGVGQKPWAVVGSAGSRDDNLTAADLRKALRKDRPSPALTALFIRNWERDPLPVCANVRGFLDQAGIVHDQAAIDHMQPKPAIFSVSLPTVSADGDEALADIGADAGAHGPVAWVVHLRKNAKGRWRTTDAMVSLMN